MKKVLKVTVGALSCLMLFATPALALNEMLTFAGSQCASTTATQPTVTGNAEASNTSASALTFICPLVRSPANLIDQATGSIWVNDAHYSSNVCCSLRSKDPGGQSVITTASSCSTGVDASVKLDFVSAIPSGTWSTRFYRCTVPGTYSGNASSVLAYRAAQL